MRRAPGGPDRDELEVDVAVHRGPHALQEPCPSPDLRPCAAAHTCLLLCCVVTQFVADRLLVALDVPKKYNVTNPFEWMELISLQGKTNFFEKRVGEYAKANVAGNAEQAFDMDADV